MSETDQRSDARGDDAAPDPLRAEDAHGREYATSDALQHKPGSRVFFSTEPASRKGKGPEIAPSDRIGQYEVISPIGRGGMGEVWLARHVQLEVERAIKLLHPFVSTDRRWRARMLREARILAQLEHANIATLYEFIDEPQRSCIVLERVVGRTLAEVIGGKPMSADEAVAICRQIAEALHYAHSRERSVVHRDLKPRNVMIRDDGMVKVLDWGIAQVLHVPTPGKTNTVRKSRISLAGTPGYMSPEQACGKQADRRADIWALGCLLYEMLAGVPAFPQQELDSFLEAVMSAAGQYPDWSMLPDNLPAKLVDLMKHCLERDLRQRIDSTEQVLAFLAGIKAERHEGMKGASESEHSSPSYLSASMPSTNLPPAMTSFVGRERVMEQMQQKLRDSRMLTLTGPGGTGKTTLATRLARTIAQSKGDADAERFPGGIWFVELASVSDPDLIGQTIAAALPGKLAQQSGKDALDIIAETISDRATLFVIDNCEHLCDGCRDALTDLLRRCPLARVLATSRQPLEVPGEQVYRVPPLSIPEDRDIARATTPDMISHFESVRLFVERAVETRHDFALTDRNAADVARICRTLDGLPLAIELAAARVRAIAVGQLAERLVNVFSVLDRSGTREHALQGGIKSRRRALEATIRWSEDLLCEAEQRLFRRLSIFRGGWTLDAAENIVTDPDAGVSLPEDDELTRDAPVEEQQRVPLTAESMLDFLEGLVEKSLVVFEEVDGWPRYRLYETVRLYAEKALRAEVPKESIERLRARHAEYFCRFAQERRADEPGPRQAVVLEWIENDHDNFRAAMEWALGRPDQADLALELANGLHWFYFVRGYGDEGLRWLRAALAHRPSKGDLLESRACNSAGMLATLAYDYDAARQFYERSLDILRTLDDQPRRAAAVLNNLGMLAQTREDRLAAFDAYEQAVAIYDRLKDRIGRARVQLNLAAVNMFVDQLTEAKKLLEESLAVLSEAEDEVRVAEIHQLLCEIADREDCRDDAVAHFRKSIALREKNREHTAILRNFFFAAVFACEAERYVPATRLMAYISQRQEHDGAEIPERHRTRLAAMLDRCSEVLDTAEYEQAWSAGRALDHDAACKLACSAV